MPINAQIKSVHHVSEQVSTMCRVFTGCRRPTESIGVQTVEIVTKGRSSSSYSTSLKSSKESSTGILPVLFVVMYTGKMPVLL